MDEIDQDTPVTARSDLCPIRVKWLQAVFMRLLVF